MNNEVDHVDIQRFDIDSAPNREPVVDRGWLAEFEHELKRAIDSGEFDVLA